MAGRSTPKTLLPILYKQMTRERNLRPPLVDYTQTLGKAQTTTNQFNTSKQKHT